MNCIPGVLTLKISRITAVSVPGKQSQKSVCCSGAVGGFVPVRSTETWKPTSSAAAGVAPASCSICGMSGRSDLDWSGLQGRAERKNLPPQHACRNSLAQQKLSRNGRHAPRRRAGIWLHARCAREKKGAQVRLIAACSQKEVLLHALQPAKFYPS